MVPSLTMIKAGMMLLVHSVPHFPLGKSFDSYPLPPLGGLARDTLGRLPVMRHDTKAEGWEIPREW